eukprot:TRINITY_DN103103_c0_g1_i1.p1 TRINITY_DN103103_c0_g1~~TRINITY_DN103103_c0_g1_i1.p1  ORF type:complete len:530 (+),score=44.40 TRINITY_DN103103_c0_g1_i1:213-1592(+)
MVKGSDGRNIAVFHTKDDKFYAMDNACYHHGGPLLNGPITKMGDHVCVKCPWHGYLLELETGNGIYMGLSADFKTQEIKSKGPKQRVHQVVVEANIVYIMCDLGGNWESDGYAKMELANRDTDSGSISVHSGIGGSNGVRSGQVFNNNNKAAAGGAPPKQKQKVASKIGDVKCISVVKESDYVKTFTLRLQPPYLHQNIVPHFPGQYATFTLPLEDNTQQPMRRTWTISSHPNGPLPKNEFQITVKKIPNGAGSTFMHDQFAEGSTLALNEVDGNFSLWLPNDLIEKNNCKILMIAGGVGITPLMSMLRSLFAPATSTSTTTTTTTTSSSSGGGADAGPSKFKNAHTSPFDITLLYSEKREDLLLFRKELEEFEQKSGTASCPHKLQLFLNLTNRNTAPIGWQGGLTRLSMDIIKQVAPDYWKRVVFMCAPEQMMRSLKQQFGACGFPMAQIITEEFDF